MTLTVDFNQPYRNVDKDKDPDFIEQNGKMFAWSESNIRYELAWWLDPNIEETPLVKTLREERPLISR